MAEGDANVEVAHHLTGHRSDAAPARRWHRLVELVEVAVLAIVAVVTAWSGYQAAKWNAEQSFLYGRASTLRFEADAASTFAGQELSANAAMFTAWLEAHSGGDTVLQTELARRFTTEYRVAFDAWLDADPFEDLSAPPGPAAMPEYKNSHQATADRLNAEASEDFEEGTDARETGDSYVRDTVLLAMVLFLVAIGQRFSSHAARLGVNVIAAAVLAVALISVLSLPRT